jgi:hypothetical protein
MATNKRKESAALFELIGKSTLKVPKNASALKIPEWWSSKTNPPSTPPKTAPNTSDETLDSVAATATDITPVPAQHRLFEPPPADVKSGVSPSIRPPGPAAANGSSSTVRASPALETKPVTSAVPVSTPKPERANPVRIFAPQTMSQSAIPLRRGGMGGSGGESYRHNGRIPLWALVMAVVVLVLVVVTVVAAIYTWAKSRHAVPTHASSSSALTVQLGNVVLPPTASLLPPVAPVQPLVNSTPVSNDTADSTAKGTVYGPGVIQRSPDLYYVIIASTPSAPIAKRNADFLADHGIDVSIEISTGPGGKGYWYRLVSVQGYPSTVTGNPFLKRIVLIGHLHPDFKKGKPMWDDALLARVKAPAK